MMLAMLRKDLYCMWKFGVLTIAACVWASLTRNLTGELGMGLFVLAVYSLFIPVNAIAVDERYQWDRFAAMLPVQPWEIVLEKYLLSWCQMVLAFGLSALICWVRGSENLTAQDLACFGITVFTVLLLVESCVLPVVYRFGKQKAMNTVIYPLVMVMWALLFWLRGKAMMDLRWLFRPSVLLLAAAVNLASVRLSTRFYTRRQRGWYN